jgi:type I restriction enzyme S subunit
MVETETKVQRYERYKDSGVAWLGEIPEHWKIERGKWLFKKKERPVREEDKIVTCFRDGEVTLRSNRKNSGFTVALKEHGYQGIRKGDLVIHAMDAFAGAIGVSDSDGKSTPVYSVCSERVTNTVNQYYYSYFLRSLALNGIILALAKGIRERSTDFRFNDFGELLLSFPPLKEQTAIAQFLDDKTTKIDEAIAIKEQQISLLKERKQILIHKAVTQGLNPNVRLKDSGVEWIGEIPEHWNVSRLGLMLTPYSIKNYPNETLLSITRELGVIKRDLEDMESNHNFIPDDLSGYKLIEKGDFGMNKMKAWQGSYGVSKFTGIISPAYFTFKLVETINPDFFHLAIRSKIYVPFFGQASDGVRIGQWDLSKDRMKRIPFVIPALKEQKEVLDYIEVISKKIKTAIGLKKKEIAKLKEYKSSLINSVVTGKIRVC